MAIDPPNPNLADATFGSPIRLRWLSGQYRVCRLGPHDSIPDWALKPALFLSISRTAEELSIVAEAAHVPPEVRSEGPFAAMAVVGPIDFGVVGLLARLTAVLAEARIPVLANSTFDTDILLVGAEHQRATQQAIHERRAASWE